MAAAKKEKSAVKNKPEITSDNQSKNICYNLLLYPFQQIKLKYFILVLVAFLLYNLIVPNLWQPEAPSNDQEATNKSIQSESPKSSEIFGDELIDWHDYGFLAAEKKRRGIGEHGQSAFVSKDEKAEEKQLMKVYGFNGLLSDKIPLNRSIKDTRPEECKAIKYPANLPAVSAVIIFNNEHLNTLKRTVVSIINRTPQRLLNEIILVDDGSDMSELHNPLEAFVAENRPIVKLIRTGIRIGLIQARLLGARQAISEILVFFDAHCEANTNWLPPLLEPLRENYKRIVCPSIDRIDMNTFEYDFQDRGARGAFDWEFSYKRLPRTKESMKNPTKPFPSPVMAGGLFAVNASYFWEIGAYDEELEIWGGEQYELSFKVWMCGGEILDAPCSHVGHVFRTFDPRPDVGEDHMFRNYKRVAEVWMDEYKEFIYSRYPETFNRIDAGDLTQQKALRERLNCKSFKWFMTEVAYDLVEKYPTIEPPNYASGAVQSLYAPEGCVTIDDPFFELGECDEDLVEPESDQFYELTWRNEIREKGSTNCWDVADLSPEAPVKLFECHHQGGNQWWSYDPVTKWIIHGKYNKRCLDFDVDSTSLILNKCEVNNGKMRWAFGFVNETLIASSTQNIDA